MLAQGVLFDTWNITDRATADEKLDWLLTEGDRADVASFYTEEESLALSLEIAENLQTIFVSRDSFMESYFSGYEFHGNDSSEQRTIYEERRASPDNPFRLDWNMTLEKVGIKLKLF